MAGCRKLEWLSRSRRYDCPCCGSQLLNDDGRVVQNPCQHFLFHINGTHGGFSDWKQEVESRLPCPADVLSDVSSTAAFGQQFPAASLLTIEVHDHAGGPVIQRDVVAFDPFAA